MTDNAKAVGPIVLRAGGGIIFVVREDCVDVLRIYPGQKPDDVLEVIGTANRENIGAAAAALVVATQPERGS